jgi:16S rRNA (cytosine1407-C5)-methyltransferase
MNNSFKQYFKENFFPDEKILDTFIKSLGKPLKKTIRVNTNKISVSELKERLELQNYILTPTFQENVFYIER